VTSNRTTRVDWGRSEHARLIARPQRKKSDAEVQSSLLADLIPRITIARYGLAGDCCAAGTLVLTMTAGLKPKPHPNERMSAAAEQCDDLARLQLYFCVLSAHSQGDVT
jgi:hypothetical protein